jgi:Spy/CpxP family protein refolding chaperone
MQRRAIISLIAVMAVILTGSLAIARPWGGGPNSGYGPGRQANLSPEKAAAVQAIVDKHREAVFELREKLWAKNAELDAWSASGKATRQDVQELTSEITTLRTRLREQRRATAEEIAKETGQSPDSLYAGGGYGRGRHGRSHGRGHRGGYGMDRGGGYGGCPAW